MAEREKPRGQEALFARLYLRRCSAPLTRWLSRTRVTPNQVTVAFLLLMFAGAVLQLEQRLRWVSIAGALAMQLGLVLDAVDGEIARIKRIFSIKGVYLDMVGHRLAHALLFGCTGIGLSLRSGEPVWIYLGFAGSYGELALTLMLYAKWRALADYPDVAVRELERIRETSGGERRRLKAGFMHASRPSAFRRFYDVWFGTDYVGALLFTLLVAAIADRMGAFLAFYAVLQAARAVRTFVERASLPFTPERTDAP